VRKPLVVLAAVTAAALFAGHGSSSPRPRPLQLRGLAATHSLLAFRWTRDSGYLARVRATTLQPLRGKQMMISGQSSGWSFSPDRRQLALGDTSGGGEIWLVDTRRLKLAGRLSTGNYGVVVETAWTGDRLLAVLDKCCYGETPSGELAVAVMDLSLHKVVASQELRGTIQATGSTGPVVVLLLGPPTGIGPTRLLVVDAHGRVRSSLIERILPGNEYQDNEPVARTAQPGLALDETGKRAFVVGAGAPVAEVDLETLGVTYHELSSPVSLIDRVRNWLDPSAFAKSAPNGPERHALWLGDGTLAVWGVDNHVERNSDGNPTARQTAAGIHLIETRTWTERTIDANASSLTVADGMLIATGALWDSGTQKMSGAGLTGYGPDGSKRFHRFGSASLSMVHALGSRVFVQDRPGSYSVLEAGSGRTLRRLSGQMPQPLAR
jgi:hypothetical protein